MYIELPKVIMPAKKQSKPTTTLIDLRKELLIQVDSSEEKEHVIKWDVLKTIGDATQNLIYKIAKYSLEDNTLPPEALKLEFIGFHKGSAVPDFRLPTAPNLLFNSDKAYQNLNVKFNSIVNDIEKGNFQQIADSFSEPLIKNEMIEAVYNFSNSAGTKPLRIVKRNKVGSLVTFSPILTVRPMVKKTREQLKVVGIPLISAVVEDEFAVAKVILKRSRTGRLTNKIAYLHSEKEAILSLSYDSIETENRLYNLKTMVSFTITEETKNSVSIENQLLDIYAFGKNKEEAKTSVFDQFDYNYQRLQEFEDAKLSQHLLAAKKYFQLIVGNVKNK